MTNKTIFFGDIAFSEREQHDLLENESDVMEGNVHYYFFDETNYFLGFLNLKLQPGKYFPGYYELMLSVKPEIKHCFPDQMICRF